MRTILLVLVAFWGTLYVYAAEPLVAAERIEEGSEAAGQIVFALVSLGVWSVVLWIVTRYAARATRL